MEAILVSFVQISVALRPKPKPGVLVHVRTPTQACGSARPPRLSDNGFHGRKRTAAHFGGDFSVGTSPGTTVGSQRQSSLNAISLIVDRRSSAHSGQPRRSRSSPHRQCGKTRSFVLPGHEVRVLHRLAGCALAEVVDRRQRDGEPGRFVHRVGEERKI